MIIKFIVSLMVFAGIFYLANLFYPSLEEFLSRWQKKKKDKVAPRLDRMSLDIPFKKLMLMDILAPLISGGLGYYFAQNIIFALVCAAAGLALPFIILKRIEAVRRRKFSSQLVDGLMILSTSLKAGLSLTQSFEPLIEEMPAPISKEFGIVLWEVRMGASLEDAMLALKKRMRVDELDLVVTAMLLARETGGNLTEIFSQVATTIQERNKLIGRVNALCVQGKLQGAIMSALPVLFGIVIYKLSPNFADVFIKNPLGRMLLGYAVISELLGVFFIRKLSRIDI